MNSIFAPPNSFSNPRPLKFLFQPRLQTQCIDVGSTSLFHNGETVSYSVTDWIPANVLTTTVWQSKQYLQTHTLPLTKQADVFALATTKEHLLVASGSSSIEVYSTKRQVIHSDSEIDEHPYPLVQTLEKVHPLGVHHITATSIDGGSEVVGVAASAGFGGEVKVWECINEEGGAGGTIWRERGEIAGTALPNWLRPQAQIP